MTGSPDVLSSTANSGTGAANNFHRVQSSGPDAYVYVRGPNSLGVTPEAKMDTAAPGAKAQARLDDQMPKTTTGSLDPIASTRAQLVQARVSPVAISSFERYAASRRPAPPKPAADPKPAVDAKVGPQQTLTVAKNSNAEQEAILRNGPTNRTLATLNFMLRVALEPVSPVIGAGLKVISAGATPVAPTIANSTPNHFSAAMANQPRPAMSLNRVISSGATPVAPSIAIGMTTLAALPSSPSALRALKKPIEEQLAATTQKPPQQNFTRAPMPGMMPGMRG